MLRQNIRDLLRILAETSVARSLLPTLGRRGLLPSSIWKRLPVSRSFGVTLPDGSAFSYTSIVEEGIGRALYWRGWTGYEPEVTSCFYSLAKKADVVVDVGAHTGLYTLLACAANPRTKVISFEPVPDIFRRLEQNIRNNGWSERCITYQAAVSNQEGKADLFVPAGPQPVGASLHSEGFIAHNGSRIDVSMMTIDAACAAFEQVALIKIDAEGFEDKVLEGMEQVIQRSRPYIILECMPEGPYQSVEGILKASGYHLYHLVPEGAVAVDAIRPHSRRLYPNYLAAPNPYTEAVVR